MPAQMRSAWLDQKVGCGRVQRRDMDMWKLQDQGGKGLEGQPKELGLGLVGGRD